MINKTYDLKSIKSSARNNLPFFSLLCIFLAGLILALLYTLNRNPTANLMLNIISNNTDHKSFTRYFLLVNLLLSFLIIMNGFSMLGKPFTMVLLFVYSFLLGILLIMTFKQQSGNNLIFFFLFYILPSILFSISQISACIQSVFFSSDLYYNYFKNSTIKTKIRTYLKRYALIILLICSGGVVMSIVSAVYIRFVF